MEINKHFMEKHIGEKFSLDLIYKQWWNPFNWELVWYCKKCKEIIAKLIV